MFSVETNEKSSVEVFKTHYYKTSYEKIKATFLNFAEKKGMNIVSIDDQFSEIFVEYMGHMSIQTKIIEQTPVETSIDFYVNSEFLFGNKKKTISLLEEIYHELEKNYELKGLGLHP